MPIYLQTQRGKVRINEQIAQKYRLKAGTLSPNTGYPIVQSGMAHNAVRSAAADDEMRADIARSYPTVDAIRNPIGDLGLSTAEILDISQGVDSSNR
ncbi:MAG: hypothetical protein PHO66_01560 [Eubacteriales bacterium]|nr:hypothetical protein [Eubacteriales bacterium]